MSSKLSGNAGSGLDTGMLSGALGGLLGGGNEGGGLDIGGLLGNLQSKGLGDAAASWLGDGENEAISGEQVTNLFGSEKISEFASQLGLSENEAAGGLADALPQMVDNASSGGGLLDSIGGLSGAAGMAGKLFGR